ncbi:MAG: hypothetical protein WCV63_10895 [Negativicutes bacterium]
MKSKTVEPAAPTSRVKSICQPSRREPAKRRLMLEGKTLTQAARQMRITPQAVKNLLNRARKIMLGYTKK